jgi:hypothetical protein
VVDRLRALLDGPFDPVVARAVVLLACAVTLGLTIVVGLGGEGGSDQASRLPATRSDAATSLRPTPPPSGGTASDHRIDPRQDPQDRPGSAAARRADRELSTHLALQHLPYRHGGVAISLIGARGTRAVLRVEAAGLAAARRGWRRFLRRYRDGGRAYRPVFRSGGGDAR